MLNENFLILWVLLEHVPDENDFMSYKLLSNNPGTWIMNFFWEYVTELFAFTRQISHTTLITLILTKFLIVYDKLGY